MLRLTDVGRKTGGGEGLGGPGGYIDNAVLGRVGVVVLGFYMGSEDCVITGTRPVPAGPTPYAHKH